GGEGAAGGDGSGGVAACPRGAVAGLASPRGAFAASVCPRGAVAGPASPRGAVAGPGAPRGAITAPARPRGRVFGGCFLPRLRVIGSTSHRRMSRNGSPRGTPARRERATARGRPALRPA